MNFLPPNRLRTLASTAVLLASHAVLWGQYYRTWDDGHSSDDWSRSGNWSSNNKPGNSNEVARFSNGNAGTSSIDINSNQRTGGMLFDANLTIDITFTRASSELSIRNGGSNYGIINNSSRTITFENQMGIEQNMTWKTTNASGGGLIFEQEVDTDGFTLTFETTNDANFITVSGNIVDSGGINKTGDGILTLSGTNTFTGAINVTGGILSISSQENLGSLSASADLTLNGGTLRIDGGTVDNDNNTRVLVLGASGGTIDTVSGGDSLIWDNGISGSGDLTKTGDGLFVIQDPTTFTGDFDIQDGTVRFDGGDNRLVDTVDVTIASGATLDTAGRDDTIGSIAGGGDITLGGSDLTVGASDATTEFSGVISESGTLTKTGTGNLTLSGANTYTGATTVSDGTLTIANDTALGTTAADTTVNDSTTLAVTNNISVAENITNNGTVTNSSGTNTLSGAISGTGEVTTTGGQLTLSGNNTYTGDTTINSGSTLVAASDTALGTTDADTTVNNGGTLALTNNISVAEDVTNNGTVTNTSGTNTFSGVISGTGEVTTTSGQLTLTGNNTYTGDTTINSGSTLVATTDTALGASSNDTTVNSGGTLALTDNVSITQSTVNLAGTGNGGSGALQNISGDNQLTANFNLTADATLQSDAGTLSLGSSPGYNSFANQRINNNGFDLTVDGAGDTNLYAGYSGSGDLIKDGTGTLFIEGTVNPSTTTTFTGDLLLNEGDTVLATLYNDAPGVGPLEDFFIYGDIVVGDGTGSAGSTTLTFGANESGAGNDYSNLLDSGVNVTVNADGFLDTQGHTQYVQDITLDGGSINADNSGGSGNNLFVTGDIFSTSTTQTATIDGKLDFDGDGSKTIDVDTGSTLDINARIQDGGFDKQGDGTLILSGSNTFTGQADISDGIVRVDHNSGLGATAGSTNVDSGAQLQLDGVTIGSEALTLNGSGIAADGALATVASSGANSWAGTVTLASASEIQTNSGSSLTLSGTITGAGQTLTVDGAGDTTFSGNNTYATLNQTGAGTLTLSGGNKTVSTLNVSAGTLDVATSNIIADSADLNLSGTGTFSMTSGINETIDQISVTGGDLDIDGILTMNGGTISGGDGSASDGTMVLTAGNTLNITNDFDFGGTLELTAGTTLALAGDSTFNLGTLNVTGNTVIDFGAGSANTLNLDSLSIAAGTTIDVLNWVSFQDLWTTGSFNGGSGSVTIDERDDNTAQITFNGYDASDTIWLTFDYGANEITVPEPRTYGATLMALGLATLLLRRPRRAPTRSL